MRGNQTCTCPKGKVVEQTGPYEFRCVCPKGSVEVRGLCITCPKGTRWDGRGCASIKPAPAPKPPTVLCSGGTVVRGICVCPQGTTRRRRGPRLYRCVPLKLQTIPSRKPIVAPKPPKISCRGGAVVRGICVCPRGTTRQQRGGRSYRCVPLKLQTIPGKVRCPRGTKLVNGRCVRVVR